MSAQDRPSPRKKRRSRSGPKSSERPAKSGAASKSKPKSKSKQTKRSGYRLFIALYPPMECVRSWLGALGAVEGLPSYRTTPDDGVHLTVQFVGDRPKSDLPAIIESTEHAWGGRAPFLIRATSIGLFPTPARAKVIAAHLELPQELTDLKRRLVHRLAKRPRQDGSDVSGFQSHCTLGRFRTPQRFDDAPRFAPLDEIGAQSFPVERIVVVKSTLTDDGPIHERIATLPFESYDAEA